MGSIGIKVTTILSDRLTFPLVAVSCAVVHLAVFLFSRHLVTGSSVYYFAFAACACLMLVASFRAQMFSALCLGVFLWLGLWMKFVVHLYNPAVLIEPVGQFDGSIGQYDQVMLVGTVACLAVGLVFLGARALGFKTIIFAPAAAGPTPGFQASQIVVWAVVMLAIAVVSIVNMQLGIVQSGLIAQRVLPLKGNAMFSQFLYTGYFFLMAYFLERDLRAGRSMLPGLLTAVIAGALVSISLISRGLVVFHSMTIILAILVLCMQGARSLKWPMLVLTVILSVGSLFVTIEAVDAQRKVAFASQVVDLEASSRGQVTEGVSGLILNLAIARWVGSEGTMVAAGHDAPSMDLLIDLMFERPQAGVASAYQYIAGSHYARMSNFQFSTLPGPAGVFYLSGSLVVVFLGLGCLALFAVFYEYVAARMTSNIFATAFVGVTLANMIAQFGIAPVNLLKALFTLTVLVGALFVLRRLSSR